MVKLSSQKILPSQFFNIQFPVGNSLAAFDIPTECLTMERTSDEIKQHCPRSGGATLPLFDSMDKIDKGIEHTDSIVASAVTEIF